jgi:hypothetical protein
MRYIIIAITAISAIVALAMFISMLPIMLSWDQVRERKEGAFKALNAPAEEMRQQELYTGYDFR